MRNCPHCLNTAVIEDGYCGHCRQCTLPALAVKKPAAVAGAARGSEASSWLVRMVEGMRRDTYGIFVDGSVRPIIKSKNEAELQRVADAHNKTLPQND